MNVLNHDGVHSIMNYLDLKDALSLARTCKKNYTVFLERDALWQKWANNRFGHIDLNDVVNCINWLMAYKHFMNNYNKIIEYARQLTRVKSFNVETHIKYMYKTLLFRQENKPMVIPAISKIKPKHGDIILRLAVTGYRNDGVSFWDDKLKICIDCYRGKDEYGSVPLAFYWPEFPIEYYMGIIAHNNLVNFKVKKEDIFFTEAFWLLCNTIKIKINSSLSLTGLKVMLFDNVLYSDHGIFILEFDKYEDGIYLFNLF